MTPTELEQAARQRYNAINDTFFGQQEIFDLIYAAQLELAMETYCIKNTYQTTSVADQDEYDAPSNAIAIMMVEYDYREISPINKDQRRDILGNNASSLITGTPDSYWLWGDSIFLVKTPSEDGLTIRIYSYDMPQSVSSSSTLDVPSRYHPYIIDYVLSKMYSKDKRFDFAEFYLRLWQQNLDKAKAFEAKRKQKDTIMQVRVDPDYTFGKD